MLQSAEEGPVLAKRLKELTSPTSELEEGLLVSATYDGDKRKAVLKFYDSRSERVWLWEDNTGHRPYCYTRLSDAEIASAGVAVGKNGVVAIEPAVRRDLLSDSEVVVRKITASDPLAIGGSPGSLREKIECWEADIKYFENYVYDRGLKVGTYYKIAHGELAPVEKEVAGEVRRSLDSILARATGEAAAYIKAWAELLGQPLATFKRIACDIEVANEENRIPDPEIADREVIAVSFYNDKESVVYMIDKTGQDKSLEGALTGYSHTVFPDEASLLRATFAKMMEYPFLITFNGDDFDLRYLKHRAMRKEIGIKEEEIPIALQRQEASLKHGVHIDLYRFFNNRSIQVYVYNNRYSEHTLNGIAEALLGKEKFSFEGNIAELPLVKLADYCLNDSALTYELTSANDSLLMKMLLVISRIAKMPMNDAARLGVSNWIRSMLFYDHRRIGALIPRTDELKQKGGASSEAIIKGKKYKGGLVIEPKPGIYFGVSVLDFASLYPSIIKVHNLSYETVNCIHEECRSNRVPDTDHWICRKRSGIESLLIGSLRDLRVGHYKVLAKDKTLPKESKDLYSTVTQGLKVILNACFSGDTFVVTPDGIKNIKDFRVGDQVINVNPATLEVEVDKIVAVQAFRYDGDMYHFANKRFVDLMVTPNHRLLTVDRRKSSSGGATFRTAEEIRDLANVAIPKLRGGVRREAPGRRISMLETARELNACVSLYPPAGTRLINWFRTLPPALQKKVREHGRVRKLGTQPSWTTALKNGQSRYELPADTVQEVDIDAVEAAGGRAMLGEQHSRQIPARFSARDFASLCGWFVSEGNPHSSQMKVYANGRVKGGTSGIVVSQGFGKGNAMGAHYRGEIQGLLGRLGLRSIQDSGRNRYFKVSSSILNKWVMSHCFAEGQGHGAAAKRVPNFVFESTETMREFLASAYKGDGNRRGVRYSTVSTRLAQDMVVLLSFLGFKAKLSYDSESRIYRIVFKNVTSKLTYSGAERRKRLEVLPFEGTVYCVTTEKNHTVIAGRNGKFVPVGQSYGVMGFETFALYCLPVADATAAFGRDAITRTIEKCSQEDVSVIYSDTDSLFIENPDKQKIADVLKWAEKELGVELEVDKTYRYVAFSQLKKNYFGVLQDGTADIKGLTGKKSVDGETSILARVNGITTFTTVADVYNKFVERHSVELISVGEDLRTTWARVNDATRHEVDDIYVLRTSKGRILKLSGDHSVFFMDPEGRLYSKETRKALVGDVLVGTRFIPLVAPSKSIDLKGHLPETIDRKGMLFSSRAHSTTGVPIPRTLPLTKDVGLIFGLFVAEGSTSKDPASRSNCISQNGIVNPEVCRGLVAAWSTTFGWEIKQFGPPDRRVFYLPILYARLFRETCGAGSAEKHIPDFIFNAPLEVIEAFLRGLFSGDGYSNGRRISIASESRRLIEETGYLLAYFDIDTRIRVCYNSRFGIEYYQLSVIGTSSRRRFQELIGFLQPRFQKMPDSGPRNKELLPLSTVGLVDAKASILKRLGLRRFRHVNMHDVRFFNLSLLKHYNQVIDSLARHADDAELATLARIRNMLNTQDVTYDEIVELKRLPGSCVMYDFSVPGAERFVAGNLPTLLHNSQTPEFLKKEFYEMLDILVNVYSTDDFVQAKARIKKLLTDMVASLKERKIPIEDLSFNVMMGKSISGYRSTKGPEPAKKEFQGREEQSFLQERPEVSQEVGISAASMSGLPQHVKAAILLRSSNREVKAGELISFVKTKGGHGVKPTVQAKPEDIDVEKYIEYASSMFDQVLGALDLSFESVVPKTSLDAFWS
ncbi:MAG TPA: DNA polymerase domain-containing protein [Nitrososphaerales archaeon]|nr:DNA polymerase domain-containing protein [Nitrososphaerales archaeon]